MSTSKNVGGDRLGSGNKMKVSLHGYQMSTHDLGSVFRTTMSAGTLVPFINKIGLPGDTFDIDLNADVKTHPTVGPLFGSFKLQLDVFLCPMRLYIRSLHNNKLALGMNISAVKFPVMTLNAEAINPNSVIPPEQQQISQSSLLAYLGIRGLAGSMSTGHVTVNKQALSMLSYWDIYKNYYANKMEDNGYVIHAVNPELYEANIIQNGIITDLTINTPSAELANWDVFQLKGNKLNAKMVILTVHIAGTSNTFDISVADACKKIITDGQGYLISATDLIEQVVGLGNVIDAVALLPSEVTNHVVPSLLAFPLANIDTMRDNLLSAPVASPYVINPGDIKPYSQGLDVIAGGSYKMWSYYDQEGLGIKTYQSDLFNNWLKTEWVNNISSLSAVSTVGNSFTIDALNISKKVYDLLNRVAVSGGTYSDYIEAVYDHNSSWKAETPMYMGGLSKEIVFQEVVSSVEASTEKPLGTLAGRGVLSHKHKGGHIHIKIDEPSIIMGIVSITPRVDYSQGNDWSTGLQTLDDLHKPQLDGIGYQDLITEPMAFWDSSAIGNTITKMGAGKQPAWLNYMTDYNKTYGNFADSRNEMYMTLNRRYVMSNITNHIQDLTTYIDPAKFNYAFAQQDLGAMNFWVQIATDITARRKMSYKQIPNL